MENIQRMAAKETEIKKLYAGPNHTHHSTNLLQQRAGYFTSDPASPVPYRHITH